jgi:hypothetical protein
MGVKLARYFEYVAAKGGLVLQLKLAMKTRLTSVRAAAEPDSPELVRTFHAAVVELVPGATDVPPP